MQLYQNQSGGTVSRARQLRRDATEAEKHLLRVLREGFPDRKWRRQVPIGPYFADILCFSEKLVIEVDGGQHAAATGYDGARTRFIEGEGYRVLRFWNNDVLENAEGVLTQISFSVREKEGARAAQPRGKDEGEHATKKSDAVTAASPSPFRSLSAAPSLSRREREI